MKKSHYATLALVVLALIVLSTSSCSKRVRAKDTAYKYSGRFL